LNYFLIIFSLILILYFDYFFLFLWFFVLIPYFLCKILIVLKIVILKDYKITQFKKILNFLRDSLCIDHVKYVIVEAVNTDVFSKWLIASPSKLAYDQSPWPNNELLIIIEDPIMWQQICTIVAAPKLHTNIQWN